MNQLFSRNNIWQGLQENPLDIIVIGGGVTGAGIFYEAARQGYRTLLLEQADFASGTSSRSSKLVHGGLRYLREGHICVTREALQEREWLVQKSRGLVTGLPFLMPLYRNQFPSVATMHLGLGLYDLLALRWRHGYVTANKMLKRLPEIKSDHLRGGFWFGDAKVDDARLTLRLVQEGKSCGGIALNYAKVAQVNRDKSWKVLVIDNTNQEYTLETKAVVNATGAWSNQLPIYLARQKWESPKIRPLRGSHLVFPSQCLPVQEALMLFHPRDKRPIFVLPWEGVTIVGTTDLDHEKSLAQEPAITSEEVSYLFELLQYSFPHITLRASDLLSTYSGVRPIVTTGNKNPSEESRASKVTHHEGYIAVSGGKLTTFRSMAQEVMKYIPAKSELIHPHCFEEEIDLEGVRELPADVSGRIIARFGQKAGQFISSTSSHCQVIPTTNTLWAELIWAAQNESVVHLDDLLLRRTRLGLLMPQGGQAILPEVRALCQAPLGWSDENWQAEAVRYKEIWQKYYYL